MINISELTKDTKTFADALTGKWEYKCKNRHGTNVKWVILGRIAFCDDETSRDEFPYEVIGWHESDGGYWGILK